MKITHKYSKQYCNASHSRCPEDITSIVHDTNNWFFTQSSTIWKFPFRHKVDQNDPVAETNRKIINCGIPVDLKKYGFNQFGDLYYCKGYLFVQTTGNENLPVIISIFRASDLRYMGRFPLWRREINAYRFDANFDDEIEPGILQRAQSIMMEKDLNGDDDPFFDPYWMLLN
jgi:hypothetical protein